MINANYVTRHLTCCIISVVLWTHCLSQSSHQPPLDTVKVLTYKIKGKTASGRITYKIKEPFLAVSRDLLPIYPINSIMVLYDCRWAGKYRVLDIMGKKHTSTVDIYYTGKKKKRVKCLCKPFETTKLSD